MFEAIVHHIEQAARKAGVRWTPDCTAELKAEDEALERRFRALEAEIRELREQIGAA